MKKLPKLIVLCLASLTMVGCQKQTSSTTSNSSSQPSSISSEEKPSASSDPISSLDKPSTSSDPISSTKDPISSSGDSSSPSDPSDTSLWNSTTLALMDKFLDGKRVPYVDLGGYVSSYNNTELKSTSGIKILGDTFDASKLDGFKATFDTAGWTTSKTSSELDASKDGITVEIKRVEDGDSFVMDIFYNIPYDESKAPTAWDSETKLEMDANLNNHAVPYIYLGTPECYTQFMSATSTLNVYGFNFDAKIITNARAALTSDGWTIQDVNGTYGAGIIATKDFGTDVLTVTLSTPAPGDGSRYYITIKITESWNPTAIDNWQAMDIQTFKDEFDGHVPDYFYLGTSLPWCDDYSDRYRRITINGGKGDTRIIPLAKTTLKDKGWTVSVKADSNGTGLVAVKEYEDGCTLRIEIPAFYSTDVNMYAYVYYVPKLTLPAEADQVWPSDIQKLFNTKLNGHALPYIYLGSNDLDAYFDKDLAQFEIKPTQLKTFSTPKIITNAENVLNNDGYTVTTSSNNYGDTFKAIKQFDDGDKLILTMESMNQDGRAVIKGQYVEAFNPNYTSTWSSDRSADQTEDNDTTSTQYLMNKNLHNHKVPYIYLGAKSFTSSIDDSTGAVVISGGKWDSRILTNASKAFKDDSWEVTTNAEDETDLSTATTLTATKRFVIEGDWENDKCTLTATITKPTDSDTDAEPVHATKMTITRKDDSWGSTYTDWNQEVNEDYPLIKDGFAEIGLPEGFVPYFDMGSNDLYNPYYGPTGNAFLFYCYTEFDKRAVASFDAAMTKNGWTLVDDITYLGSPLHSAMKEVKDDSGNGLGIARICIGCEDEMGIVQVLVTYDKYSDATLTPLSYSDEEKAFMKSHLNGLDESILPALVTGSSMDFSAIDNGIEMKTASSVSEYKYNYAYTQSSLKAFMDAGWTLSSKSLFTYDDDGITKYGNFSVTKNVTGGKLNAVCTSYKDPETYAVNFDLKITYEEDFNEPASEDAKWNDEVTSAMSSSMDGYILPFLYLGKKEADFKAFTKTETSSKVLSLTGKVWDDKIITNLKAALKADTVITDWTLVDVTSSQSEYGALVYATGTYKVTIPPVYDDDGETILEEEKTVLHTVTLKLYKDTKNNNVPVLEVFYK